MHDGDGVTVHTDAESLRARAAIVTMSPRLRARIDFSPRLPGLRDRLQQHWLAGRGAKLYTIYDTPW